MKKFFTNINSLFRIYKLSRSQCTPDPIYQDSTYNIWPGYCNKYALKTICLLLTLTIHIMVN